jgi:hypothetical protein
MKYPLESVIQVEGIVLERKQKAKAKEGAVVVRLLQ